MDETVPVGFVVLFVCSGLLLTTKLTAIRLMTTRLTARRHL